MVRFTYHCTKYINKKQVCWAGLPTNTTKNNIIINNKKAAKIVNFTRPTQFLASQSRCATVLFSFKKFVFKKTNGTLFWFSPCCYVIIFLIFFSDWLIKCFVFFPPPAFIKLSRFS